MPAIPYTSYPHLVENIVFHADYEMKIAFRLTCSALHDCADSLLCGPTISYPEGEVGCHRLPFFHPDSGKTTAGRAKQYRAINAARLILLDSAVATREANEALSNIHPDSRVVLNHERDAVATYCLPELAELTILGSHQCRCNDVDGGFDDAFTPMDDNPHPPTLPGDLRDPGPRHLFTHGAREVHIDLSLHPTSEHSHHFRCALAKCALTRDVRRLTITVSEIFHLGMVLAPLQQKLKPGWRHEDFEIEVRFRGTMPEFDVRALLAGLIELQPERVTIEDI